MDSLIGSDASTQISVSVCIFMAIGFLYPISVYWLGRFVRYRYIVIKKRRSYLVRETTGEKCISAIYILAFCLYIISWIIFLIVLAVSNVELFAYAFSFCLVASFFTFLSHLMYPYTESWSSHKSYYKLNRYRYPWTAIRRRKATVADIVESDIRWKHTKERMKEENDWEKQKTQIREIVRAIKRG